MKFTVDDFYNFWLTLDNDKKVLNVSQLFNMWIQKKMIYIDNAEYMDFIIESFKDIISVPEPMRNNYLKVEE